MINPHVLHAGVAGSVVGWGVAAYRNLPSHVYILSLGANCAVATGAFMGGCVHSMVNNSYSYVGSLLASSPGSPQKQKNKKIAL